MTQSPETSTLIGRLVPTPETLRRVMLAHAMFRLSAAHQYATRTAYRVTLSMAQLYESRLPSGRFDGLRLVFYVGCSRSQLVECYVDGERHGPRRIWRINGRLAHHDVWNHDMPCGAYNAWYENGTPKIQTQYVAGMEHGRFMSWFKSGQLAEQYDKEFDQPHGVYMSWYGNGQLYTQREYAHGIPHGSHLCWYDNGQQRKQQTFVKGERRGDYKRWTRDGTLTKHVIYECRTIVGDDTDIDKQLTNSC